MTPEAEEPRRTLPLVLLVPNLVTLLGLCAGLTALRYVVDGDWQTAAVLLVLAAFVDALDGILARKLNAASHFGAELDSLSDFVCFGVAPGFFVYQFALHPLAGLGWLLALVFTLGACLRLARFNVSRAVPVPAGGKPGFVGVPAPAGAMLGLMPVFLTLAGWVDARDWPVLTGAWLAFVGLLMISRLPTPALKGLKVPRSAAVPLLLGITLYLWALATRPWLVMVLSGLLYMSVIVIFAWRGWRGNKPA